MNIYIHLINLRIMAEVLFASHMLARLMPHRANWPLRLTLSLLGCLLLALAFPIPAFAEQAYVLWGMVMYGSIFALAMGSLAVCYEASLLTVFCAVTIGYTLHHLVSSLETVMTELLHLAEVGIPGWLCSMLALLLAYIPGYRYFSRLIRENGQIRIEEKTLPFLSLAVLMVDIVIGLYQMQLHEVYDAPGYDIMIGLLNALACVFVLRMQSDLIANRRLKTELEIVQNMLQEEKRQYENSRRSIAVINQKCHDLKHQLRTLRKQSGEVDRTVLREIEHAVEMYDTSIQTGNAALDVILTEKKLLCESKGVSLTCIADGSGMEKISPSDVYALFGNILDNAMEAVGKLDDPGERGISLSVRRIAETTVIHEENRYRGEILLEDGLPRTQKGDTDWHGFGMKSIRMIAETYHGYLNISLENGIFSLTIMLMPE